MALLQFKISYRDGATQTVEAKTHQAEGDWVCFYDDNGLVLRVPGRDVLSIARVGVPDRETPSPMIA